MPNRHEEAPSVTAAVLILPGVAGARFWAALLLRQLYTCLTCSACRFQSGAWH